MKLRKYELFTKHVMYLRHKITRGKAQNPHCTSGESERGVTP